MRWMMMGGHHFAHGFAAFMLMRMLRRVMMAFVLVGLVLAVIYIWNKSRRTQGPGDWG